MLIVKKGNMMASKRRLRVINVLDPEYYADAHIKGSINVPLKELKDFAQHTDKQTPIVVYCASYECPMSKQAWHVLHELGFQDLYAYEGGINEWYRGGFPTEGPHAQKYLHADIAPSAKADETLQTITMQELKAKMEKEGLI